MRNRIFTDSQEKSISIWKAVVYCLTKLIILSNADKDYLSEFLKNSSMKIEQIDDDSWGYFPFNEKIKECIQAYAKSKGANFVEIF